MLKLLIICHSVALREQWNLTLSQHFVKVYSFVKKKEKNFEGIFFPIFISEESMIPILKINIELDT